MGGFIKIDRKLLEHSLWLSEPFTKGQAWVDIIARANFSDREKFFRGGMFKVRRGQLPTSDVELATRWKWSRNKVRSYLAMLEKAEMITIDRTTKGTIITVKNYSKYQDSGTVADTDNETAYGTRERYQEVQSKSIKRSSKGAAEGTYNKNIKKDKNDKNVKNVKNDSARMRACEENDEEKGVGTTPSMDEVMNYCGKIDMMLPRALYRYCDNAGWDKTDWKSVALEWRTGNIPPEVFQI